MDELALDRRTGLPGHLRALADRYPREMWTGHPNFSGMTSFWLDRHLMFRELQARLEQAAEGFLDGQIEPRAFGSAVHRMGGMFITQLHGHHQIEDAHYFPMLAAKEPRLLAAFDLLDADHHAIDPMLHHMAGDANALLAALSEGRPADAPAGAFHDRVRGFARLLDRHLTDEEEIVVPVILEHGEP